MSNRIKVAIVCAFIALTMGVCDSAQAQPRASRIWGDLNPVRFSGACGATQKIQTDNAVSSVMGFWFLRDKHDTIVSRRGLELKSVGRVGGPLSEEYVTMWNLIPGTFNTYTSNYKFSGWDRKKKTVNMLKQSWIYQGWGSSSKIICYGSWAGRVKYR